MAWFSLSCLSFFRCRFLKMCCVCLPLFVFVRFGQMWAHFNSCFWVFWYPELKFPLTFHFLRERNGGISFYPKHFYRNPDWQDCQCFCSVAFAQVVRWWGLWFPEITLRWVGEEMRRNFLAELFFTIIFRVNKESVVSVNCFSCLAGLPFIFDV